MIYTGIYNAKKLALRAFRVVPLLEVAAEKRGEGELVFCDFLSMRSTLTRDAFFSSLFTSVKEENGPSSCEPYPRYQGALVR